VVGRDWPVRRSPSAGSSTQATATTPSCSNPPCKPSTPAGHWDLPPGPRLRQQPHHAALPWPWGSPTGRFAPFVGCRAARRPTTECSSRDRGARRHHVAPPSPDEGSDRRLSVRRIASTAHRTESDHRGRRGWLPL